MSMDGPIGVLHVDDEPGFADMVATFLEREHDQMSIQTVTSPADGLEQLDNHEIDCIISDYDMPGTNGIEFLSTVREQYPELPFILYTGKGSEEIASDAISAGVTDYLQKESGSGHYTVLANRISNAVDQYRSRQAVQETEQKLAELAERTDDILFMVNGDWSELLFINSAYEEVWGGSIEELTENPRSFLELVHPEDRDNARASMEQLLKGESAQLEYRVVRPDGEQRWVRGDTKPIRDEEGNTLRIVGQVRDITEQKRRELHLETIISNLPGYVYRHEYGKEYPLKFVKGDAETITGYTTTELEEEVIHAEEIIYPEDREDLWADHLEGLEATGRFDSTYRIITRDGDVRWIRDQGQLVEDPVTGEEVIDGFITDISSRIQQQRDLRQITGRLEALFEDSPDMINVHDSDGSILDANAQLCEETGYSEEELIGMKVWDIDQMISPDEAHALWAEMEIGERRELEGVYQCRDGSTFPVKIHIRRLDSGEGDRFAVISRDISEQKERERNLQQERDRLDEFASVVSHDIRNPLNIAEGRLELVREECDSEHIDSIDRALTRMDDLIDDLLTLARGGDYVSETEAVDLADLSENSWLNVETANATLRTPDDLTIRGDRSRLAQLLENLIRNAVEHGGDDVTVTVGELTDGFYFEDDGPGIPEDERDDVVDAGYSTAEDGTGFGLSIVNQIVEAHGWEIRVTEGIDGGARFEITGVKFID